MNRAPSIEPTVVLVDPDAATRKLVRDLMGTMYLPCDTFEHGQEFLDAYRHDQPGCVVLEVKIPGANGLDIQEALASRDPSPPIVFLTAHGTISIAIRAMRAGAVHFLEKPVRENELWDALREALQLDDERRRDWEDRQRVSESLEKLSFRERRILEMIAQGSSKATIAEEIEACVRTVELHHARLRKKLGLATTAQLVRFAVYALDGKSRSASAPPEQPIAELAAPRNTPK